MAFNFNPLPGSVDPDVLAAQAKPAEAQLDEFQNKISLRLKKMLYPEADSIGIFSCMREGLYETVFNSFLQTNALICVNGPFSQIWQNVAQASDIQIDEIDSPFGKPISREKLRMALEKDSYEAVLLTEIDPYTGVYEDIPALASMIREIQPETLIVTDCTASISCVKPLVIGVESDVIIAGSECVLGVPPGLGLLVSSSAAGIRSRATKTRRWYFNHNLQLQLQAEKMMHSMPPYTLLYALDKQLDKIIVEGLKQRIERINNTGKKMRSWAATHDFQILTDPDVFAPTVTILRCRNQFSPDDFGEYLNLFGITIGRCPDELRNDYVPIAHAHTSADSDLELFFEAVSRFQLDYKL